MEADHKRFDAMAYGPLGKAVKAAMPHTEADPIGVFAAVLALYSAAIGDKVEQPNGRPVVVWTALAGRSAIGRKGYALSTAEKILSTGKLGNVIKLRKRQGVSSGPSLITVMYEMEAETLTSEDGQDGRTIVVDEEWSTTLKLTNRCPKYAGVLRTSWDGKRVSNITKKDGKRVEQVVERPALGFHGHIQPGAWAKYITLTEALGGTYNRILPVFTIRSKRIPYRDGNPLDGIKPPTALASAYEWARKAEEPRRMTLHPNACPLFDEIRAQYEDRMETLPEHISCFIERSAEQVLRVASVLTAAERKEVISLAALEAAHAFVEYSVRSVEWLVTQPSTMGVGGREAKPLPEKIRDVLTSRGELNRSQIRAALGNRYTSEEILSAVEDMPDVLLEERKNNKNGPNPVYLRLAEELEEEKAEEKPAARPALKVVPAPKTPAPRKPRTPAKKAVAKAPAKAPAKKTAKKVAEAPESAFSHLI